MKADDASAAIAAGVLGPLESVLKGEDDQPNVLGSAIVFAAWLLSIVALVFAVAPIVRGMRAGVGIAASPLNLLVAAMISPTR